MLRRVSVYLAAMLSCGAAFAQCGSPSGVAGQMKWLTPSMKYCDGANWVSMSSGTPGGFNGYVQFNNSGDFGGDSGLFWDNAAKRLGIGTTVPAQKLDVAGKINFNTSGQNATINNYHGANSDGYNIFIGDGGQSSDGESGATYKGGYNTFVGMSAGYYNTTGYYNTFIGLNAGKNNDTGTTNTFIGIQAGISNTSGANNAAIGSNAGYFNTTGYDNTFVGYYAGVYQADGANHLETAHDSVYIGALARGYNNSDNNSIVIGASAIGIGANTVVLGNGSILTTALKGNVGIGTTAPATRLHVSGGDLQVGGATASTIAASGYITLPAIAQPTGSAGRIYYDATSSKLRAYNSAWNDLLLSNSAIPVSMVDLSTVATQFDAVTTDTNAIAGNLTTETTNRVAGDLAVGVTTGTIAGNLTTETTNRVAGDLAVGVTTGTIAGNLTTEIANRVAGDLAVGVTTGTIAGNLTTETANRVAGDLAIGVATGTLVGGSGTASYVPKFTAARTLANSLIYDNGTNVGIGTDSPGNYALDVKGLSSQAGPLRLLTGISSQYVDVDVNGGVRLFDGNVYRAQLVSETGSVGLGTGISANYKYAGGLSFKTSGGKESILSGGAGALAEGAFAFFVEDKATPKLVIRNNGKVGIGTDVPSSTLDVNGDAQFGSGATKSTFTAAGVLQAGATGASTYGVDISSGLLVRAGNVGIGTTNPVYDLTVVNRSDSTKQAYFDASGTWGPQLNLKNSVAQTTLSGYGTTPYMGTVTNHPFYFVTNNAYRWGVSAAGGIAFGGTYYNVDPGVNNMIISGSVGIGTTVPAQKLDVAGKINFNTSGQNATINNYYGADSVGNNIFIGDGGQSSVGASGQTYKGASNTFVGVGAGYANTTGYQNTFIGLQAGNVNNTGFANTFIGLQAGASNTSGLQNIALGVGAGLYNSTGYNNLFIGLFAGTRQADGTALLQTAHDSVYIGNSARGYSNSDNNSIVIGASAIGIGANTAVLGSDSIVTTALKGNVGIGTTVPGAVLDVNGAAQFGSLPTKSTFTATGVLKIGATGASTYGVDISSGLLVRAGSVGIGTASPSQMLEVNGTAKMTDIILTSDRRMKTDIASLDGRSALDRIMKLKPVSFRWKTSHLPDMGVIAQDLQQIFPDLVITNPDGMLSVRSMSLISPVIAALQELEARNRALEAKVKALEADRARIDRLEQENKEIKAALDSIRRRVDAK